MFFYSVLYCICSPKHAFSKSTKQDLLFYFIGLPSVGNYVPFQCRVQYEDLKLRKLKFSLVVCINVK